MSASIQVPRTIVQLWKHTEKASRWAREDWNQDASDPSKTLWRSESLIPLARVDTSPPSPLLPPKEHTHTHKYFYFFAENFSKWLKHMLNAMLLRIITVAHCKKLPWLHKRIIFDLAKHFLWLSSYLLSYYLHFRAKKNFIWSDVFVCTKQRGKTVAWVSYLPNLNIQGICY